MRIGGNHISPLIECGYTFECSASIWNTVVFFAGDPVPGEEQEVQERPKEGGVWSLVATPGPQT